MSIPLIVQVKFLKISFKVLFSINTTYNVQLLIEISLRVFETNFRNEIRLLVTEWCTALRNGKQIERKPG